jgi:diguanylate cyclase (GGDEF)-like protein/putative nucleotidyltransferase with HDIG domain
VITLRKDVRIWALIYALVGSFAFVLNLSQINAHDLRRFFLYLICANIATLGLRLTANMSMVPAGFLIMLLGVEDLSLPELLFIAFTVTLLRELREVHGVPRIVPVLYAIASVTIGIAAAQTAYRMTAMIGFSAVFPAPVIASSFVLLFNCGLATTLLKDRTAPFIGVYRRECRPLLPWFVAAAYLAYLVRCASLQTGHHSGLIALPILFALDLGYRSWSNAKTAHREELEALHRHTLETLAVAIETRDNTTQMHLRRVQVYALAVGQELGLSETELQSLNIAALLHDIGKLGIPDHILLKPGPLTAEEWEKMKTHAMVGAEMLSRMRYPDSVLAIVKAHHEKWNGCGYPLGLSGETIPIGARILSAVDCLDALASDRPYRRALPLNEAMDMIRAENGHSFDPKVVSVLERRYLDLDKIAWEAMRNNVVVDGVDPSEAAREDLGKLAARLLAESNTTTSSILGPIVSARQETHLLHGLAGDLAHATKIDEVVSAVHGCLGKMVNYDSLAVYVRRGAKVEPISVTGRNSHLFSRRPIPLAESLSGSVAQNRTPILNGDIALESCYSGGSTVIYRLQTALAVPFEGRNGMTGVLTLYHTDRNAFNRDDLRVAQAAALHLGPAVESALKYQEAEESAVTDHLTGIPNARSLAIHLKRELARASREKSTIGVLVCDLDGFKQVNDRVGHLKGNEVLQGVANGLREACRGSDYLARMGGDEFVLVLPDLKEELSSSYVDRLRAVARETGWAICGEECLSMSVGAAIYPMDGADPEKLFAEADRRMYRVKQDGKVGQTLKETAPLP